MDIVGASGGCSREPVRSGVPDAGGAGGPARADSTGAEAGHQAEAVHPDQAGLPAPPAVYGQWWALVL